MAWSSKEHHSILDTSPLSGVFFLDGDLLAKKLKVDWTKGEKSPMIAFPSGLSFPLWEQDTPQHTMVHVFGEVALPLHDTAENAYRTAVHLAEERGYIVQRRGPSQLAVWGNDRTEHVLITYDDAAKPLVNIEQLPFTSAFLQLLDDDARAALPMLRSAEKLTSDVLATIKFFSPDAGWTWYASEFDGDDLFFGLVDGYDLEYGYFTLSELEATRGPLGLPIERDRQYAPKTLRALQLLHEEARRGRL